MSKKSSKSSSICPTYIAYAHISDIGIDPRDIPEDLDEDSLKNVSR